MSFSFHALLSSSLSANLFLAAGLSPKSCLQSGQWESCPTQSPQTMLSQDWKKGVLCFLTQNIGQQMICWWPKTCGDKRKP